VAGVKKVHRKLVQVLETHMPEVIYVVPHQVLKADVHQQKGPTPATVEPATPEPATPEPTTSEPTATESCQPNPGKKTPASRHIASYGVLAHEANLDKTRQRYETRRGRPLRQQAPQDNTTDTEEMEAAQGILTGDLKAAIDLCCEEPKLFNDLVMNNKLPSSKKKKTSKRPDSSIMQVDEEPEKKNQKPTTPPGK